MPYVRGETTVQIARYPLEERLEFSIAFPESGGLPVHLHLLREALPCESVDTDWNSYCVAEAEVVHALSLLRHEVKAAYMDLLVGSPGVRERVGLMAKEEARLRTLRAMYSGKARTLRAKNLPLEELLVLRALEDAATPLEKIRIWELERALGYHDN